MISLITAVDKNYLIGNDGALPWHLPADLTYFKLMTAGKTVVMGRKTADSLHGPLLGRQNIILSRQSMAMMGFRVEHSVEDILKHYKNDNLYIIGGAEIYQQFLPYADRIFMTRVLAEFEGDTYFPIKSVNWDEWETVSIDLHSSDEKNKYPYVFQTYLRLKV